eukprot:TRINITY_DN5277_c0_g1_i1.p2 TRINITY_DN5277_c0_g1~~TRINITY_DN5277_c0_g1_i1.p2  ORF type:complete len:427 (+),score=73.96 TRINITY_DN5277_c0_g1_i1:2177-3457(+)
MFFSLKKTTLRLQIEGCREISEKMKSDHTSVVDGRPVTKILKPSDHSKGVFGAPLAELFSNDVSSDQLPQFLQPIFSFISTQCLEVEGIFRLSASKEELKPYKISINQGNIPNLQGNSDPHIATGLLGLWLRELPEPLLTFEAYDKFIALNKINDEQQHLDQLRATINSLPQPNQTVLQHLIQLLNKISLHSRVNKMSASNLSIVFGPTILYSPKPDPLGFDAVNKIVEIMIGQCPLLFKKGFSPLLTPRSINNRHARLSKSTFGGSYVEMGQVYSASPELAKIKQISSHRSFKLNNFEVALALNEMANGNFNGDDVGSQSQSQSYGQLPSSARSPRPSMFGGPPSPRTGPLCSPTAGSGPLPGLGNLSSSGGITPNMPSSPVDDNSERSASSGRVRSLSLRSLANKLTRKSKGPGDLASLFVPPE